jgi:hypothetical protein
LVAFYHHHHYHHDGHRHFSLPFCFWLQTKRIAAREYIVYDGD